jgi:hypothetical protein
MIQRVSPPLAALRLLGVRLSIRASARRASNDMGRKVQHTADATNSWDGTLIFAPRPPLKPDASALR